MMNQRGGNSSWKFEKSDDIPKTTKTKINISIYPNDENIIDNEAEDSRWKLERCTKRDEDNHTDLIWARLYTFIVDPWSRGICTEAQWRGLECARQRFTKASFELTGELEWRGVECAHWRVTSANNELTGGEPDL